MDTIPQHYPVYIYALCCPISGACRYVGKTNNIADRLKCHLSRARGKTKDTHCYSWLRSLVSQNLKPEIFVIEESSLDDWQEAERFWISYLRMIGCPLTNHGEGGEGVVFTQEIRQRISDGIKNMPIEKSIQRREKQRQAITGRPNLKLRGRKLSAEHCAKMSIARKGVPTPPYGTYIVKNPAGEEFKIENLSAFCRDNSLTLNCMRQVLTGKYRQYKGWQVRRHDEEKRPTCPPKWMGQEYLLTSPLGEEFHVQSLRAFCKEHGLQDSLMFKVAKGERNNHKGWRMVILKRASRI